jgi:hypothetical protein
MANITMEQTHFSFMKMMKTLVMFFCLIHGKFGNACRPTIAGIGEMMWHAATQINVEHINVLSHESI